MKHPVNPLFLFPLIATFATSAAGQASEVTFREPAVAVEVYDFAEINRWRMLLYGRNKPRPWNQPVVPTERFKLHLNLRPAERPDDVANPGFDLMRFNVDHWRCFAVTYDATAAMDNVTFYLGDARRAAEPDRTTTYAQGPSSPRTGPLIIGAFNPTTRGGKGDRVFRGLIDDIRIFGSATDGAGALELERIRSIQRGKNITS